ncbi:MAG: GYD domain-containing protein [Chloroflexi bacterium]|nr:GYD domain-containing protein [Chloroflexota bacterium]
MASYILLLTLAPEGREKMLRNPGSVHEAQDAIKVPGAYVLGQYGVLGDYDFVYIVEAPDNDAAARFSLELGVYAGVHVVTMPAIPLARLEHPSSKRSGEDLEQATMTPPGQGAI